MINLTPAETRASGLMLAKLGALLVQGADAEESGDTDKQAEVLRQMVPMFGVFAQLFKMQGLPTDGLADAGMAAKALAEDMAQRAEVEAALPQEFSDCARRVAAIHARIGNHIHRGCESCLRGIMCSDVKQMLDRQHALLDQLVKLLTGERDAS